MKPIKITGREGVMACHLSDIPAFPGERFTLAYPEAIGDVSNPAWYNHINPTWQEGENGIWISKGELPRQLSYTLIFTPEEDAVTCELSVTNLGKKPWKRGMAFNCFQCGAAPSIRDHDCARHWVRVGGEFLPLWQVPRVFGPRPALQLYSVEGAPLGRDIPFVDDFKSTPEVVIEPWMSIVSRDGRRLVATVSKPGLFLFQNREYSCIHCGTDFGPVLPGETAHSLNRTYFVEGRLEAWHSRMKKEMAEI